MTDTLPYAKIQADVVIFQVLNKKQPAVVDELSVDDTIRNILKGCTCWSAEKERPSMQVCHKILDDRMKSSKEIFQPCRQSFAIANAFP